MHVFHSSFMTHCQDRIEFIIINTQTFNLIVIPIPRFVYILYLGGLPKIFAACMLRECSAGARCMRTAKRAFRRYLNQLRQRWRVLRILIVNNNRFFTKTLNSCCERCVVTSAILPSGKENVRGDRIVRALTDI